MCASQEKDILLFHVSHSHYIQTLHNIFFRLYEPASFHRMPSNYRMFEHENCGKITLKVFGSLVHVFLSMLVGKPNDFVCICLCVVLADFMRI